MADDLVQRLLVASTKMAALFGHMLDILGRDGVREIGLDPDSDGDVFKEAADALARNDAEIAALRLERDDYANACKHSADDLRARDAEIAHEEQRIKDLMDAISAADKEIAELRRLVRQHELWAMEAQGRAIGCEELMEAAIAERDEQRQRAERAEARVREAPVVFAEFGDNGSPGRYPYAAIALTGEVAKRIGGKRVALVLMDTEEAK